MAPEHKRLHRYATMTLDEIKRLPMQDITDEKAHLYLWVPNALLPDGLAVMQAWGFTYKTNIIWEKIRHDRRTTTFLYSLANILSQKLHPTSKT